MDKLSQIERELISAYLDDALEWAELQQVERLLDQNAEASLWLDQLTKMRASIKQLDTPRRLEGLAERVIAQARQVAAAEGLSADHHVCRGDAGSRLVAPARSNSDTKATSPIVSQSEMGGWWMVLGTLAASLLALAFIPNRHAGLGGGGASQGLVSVPPVVAPAEPALPAVDDQSTDRQLVDTTNRSPAELHEPENLMPISLLYMLDVQMSEAAWNEGKFDQLLTQLGINGSEDFIADAETIRELVSKNLPGDLPQDGSADVALLFVHTNATVNDKLFVSIQSDKASYPSFKLLTAIVPEGTAKIIKTLRRSGRTGAAAGSYSRLIQLDDPQATLGGILPMYESARQDAGDEKISLENLEARDLNAAAVFGGLGDRTSAESVIILRKVRN